MHHRISANRWTIILAGMAISLLSWIPEHGIAQPPLRVVTSATAPFVLPRTDPPSGFSVDLWNEVARRLHREFIWNIVPDPAQVLTSVVSNEADVAIGAIAVTEDSEQIVVALPCRLWIAHHGTGALRSGVCQHVQVDSLVCPRTLVGGGHHHYLLAGPHSVAHRPSQKQGARQGLPVGHRRGGWGSMLVVATLNVEKDAPVIKRVTILLMWLIGVVMIAQLTATVTSVQTVAPDCVQPSAARTIYPERL